MKSTLAKINHECLCGTCRSAKRMVWRGLFLSNLPNGGMELSTESNHAAAPPPADKTAYLIRCDFFHITVAMPDDLKLCDGYRKK